MNNISWSSPNRSKTYQSLQTADKFLKSNFFAVKNRKTQFNKIRKKFDGYYAQYTHKVTHRSRQTHTNTCGAFWERVGPREINSIHERSFTSEPSIEKYQAKPAHVNTTVYLDVIENPVEYQKLNSETSQKRGRKLKEFVYERIRQSIPMSSWLRRYVKVRRVTKNVCKLHTKRIILNKVAQLRD